jgi:hypothetical protein
MDTEKLRRIEWIDEAGRENLRFRLQNAETLAREAHQTLMVLLAGMGAALAYVVRVLEYGPVTAVGAGVAAVTVWLTLSAAVLVVECILSRDLPVPANEPDNLWQEGWTLEMDRMGELKGLQARIDATRVRNHAVAAWLDRARLMAVASPVVFLLTALAWVGL